MILDRLTSAVYNDIVSGLRGYTTSISLSLEQLTDDIADERLMVIKEAFVKGIVPRQELLLSITCIEVDCQSMDKCYCGPRDEFDELVAHFEIPQLVPDFGLDSIEYIGSSDKTTPFQVFTTITSWRYSKYRKRYNVRQLWQYVYNVFGYNLWKNVNNIEKNVILCRQIQKNVV